MPPHTRIPEHKQDVAWAPLLQLSRLDRLQSLSVSFLPDITGLQYLARSVDGLGGLKFLAISFDEPPTPNEAFLTSLSFISRLVGLSELRFGIVQMMAPPAWLSPLTALSSIQANLRITPSDLAALAALPALRELHNFSWDACAGAGALPAACCPSIEASGYCRIRHSELASLAAAFPGLRKACIRIYDGDDDKAPRLSRAPLAPAPWRSLKALQIIGFELLEQRHTPAAFNSLLSLLRGAGELTSLELTSEEVDDDDYCEGTAFWSDADVAALLAHAPPTLESLTVYPVAALTDAAFIGCSLRPALKALRIRWSQPPQMMLIAEPLQVTPVGLLALGWALPGLERLRLTIAPGKFDGDYDEQRKSALIGQLNAMCGGGGGGVQQRRAPPALGSRACEHCGRCVDGDSDSDSEDDDELLLAIRRVRARFTY